MKEQPPEQCFIGSHYHIPMQCYNYNDGLINFNTIQTYTLFPKRNTFKHNLNLSNFTWSIVAMSLSPKFADLCKLFSKRKATAEKLRFFSGRV